MKKYRVLTLSTNSFAFNGISNVPLNLNKCIDRKLFEPEIAVWFKDEPERMDDLSVAFNNVEVLPSRRKSTLKYCFELYITLKKRKYEIVHIHANSSTVLIEIVITLIAGIRHVVLHSHNSTCENKLFHKLFKRFLPLLSSYSYACSELAGDWMFTSAYEVLNNGIETEKYRYSNVHRKKLHQKIGITDQVVIGHVGHFTNQKNHTFMVDVFRELTYLSNNVHLLLIGEGPLKTDIIDVINNYNLKEKVTLLEKRRDVNELLSAMDIFILPSHFEGLPLSGIEAQAAGLPCVVSQNISRELNVSGGVVFLPIEDSKVWAECLAVQSGKICDRDVVSSEYIGKLKEAGYDIATNCKELQKRYVRILGDE